MAKKLFVGNLSWNTNDAGLQAIFAAVGTVSSAQVITDRYSGRSRGFGFVEMSSDEEADKAIAELNGKDLDGRQITVNEARPREDRGNGGGGGRRDDRDRAPRGDYNNNNDDRSGGDMM
jgi:cold-inducible RNA-binding protein